MKGKRGQAAVEYLITYGWAFAVILAAIGVLSYFGFLNPDRYIPDSCEFGEQLQCSDFFMDDSGSLFLRFRNNFEESITITDISSTEGDVTYTGGAVDIGRGEIVRVDSTTSRTIFEGEKERFELYVTFRRTGGTVLHNVSGVMFGEVVESDLNLVS
jgi:hypothetical protein